MLKVICMIPCYHNELKLANNLFVVNSENALFDIEVDCRFQGYCCKIMINIVDV